MLSNIIMGFTTALSPANLIAVLGGGTILGICFGAMLSATMGIAVLIPVFLRCLL